MPLTEGQKKLPVALQKAILAKQEKDKKKNATEREREPLDSEALGRLLRECPHGKVFLLPFGVSFAVTVGLFY